ncbi:MAG: beta-N-acetylhexosaminidase [Clostridia bacterium]|nr:beta-N-acetylhexosaminidase [Clostridia bacterium]
MKIKLIGVKDDLLVGLNEVADYLGVSLDENGYEFTVTQKDGSNLIINCENKKGNITYSEKCHFFRAFGLVAEHINDGEESFSVEEVPQFTMNGPMFDVAQGNAAFNKKTLKELIKQLALMGLNTLMLYAEDTFEVKEQPYFGYMRARYSEDEIRELDDYAYNLGIEMIPCIQTLAHMPDTLRWRTFAKIRDYEECLLVGKPETYVFLKDIITAASRPFRTKKIHIGMDEAWKLGRGKYIDHFGYKPANEIMQIHLAKVMEIVNDLGLEPMMWDDMFFRTCGTKKYYQPDIVFPQEVIDMVPKNMGCVYWDYYKITQKEYEDAIPTHQQLTDNVIFAGGCWTWVGYSLAWKKTVISTEYALNACKKHGIKKVFMTTWGDNGTECLLTTNMIGCQLYAEHGYADKIDYDKFNKRFKFICKANVEDFALLEYLDRTPNVDDMEDPSKFNHSKFLMWQDILTGLADKNIEGVELDKHYADLAEKLKATIGNNNDYNDIFELSYHAANVLSKKSQMGLRITEAYKNGNKDALKNFAEVELPDLISRVNDLWECHREKWFKLYKAFGWDIMDMRYASLVARANSAIIEIKQYLNGELERIEELEETRLPLHGKSGPINYMNFYGQIVSPSRICPEA